MNEELKIIISATIDKLKTNINKANQEIKAFQDKVKAASKDVDSKFKSIGAGIGSAITSGCKIAGAALASITTALAGFVTASVTNYAEYEQLVGGVEKLFGNSSTTIQQYAQDAYKNAGISANDYMEQITSFSASLISSLNGDTAAAAEIGNMAVNDMADNANVFGSNITDIQNAYQGFAKQNYTMLDNLKLGYGGTKEEMERLIEDANKVKEAQGEAADLTIDSYADVIEAIHLVQNEMQITGTTANEAEGTISGSIAMTKAAWQNFMTGLADSNADIPQLVSNVVSSASSVLENIIPVVKEVLLNLPVAISEISPEAGAAFQTIVDTITTVIDNLKPILETAFNLIIDTINFVSEHTALIGTIAGIIAGIAVAIGIYNAVAAVKVAMDAAQVTTLGALIAAYLAQAAAMIVAIAPYLLIVAAIAAVIAIIVACIKYWDEIKETVVNVWNTIKEKISEAVENVKAKIEEMKANISEKVQAIKDGITAKFQAIKDSITTTIQNAKNSVVTTFTNMKTSITEKINAVKTSVTTVFTNIKSTITNKITEAKNSVLGIFDSIKTGIETKINNAKTVVSNAIEAIKGFFNFEWSLPSIKLPHFSITGSFSLNPPSIPHFSVSWYAKGGVFDNKTLFPYGNGSIGGLGENGAEAIVPLEKNTYWLEKMADMVAERQSRIPVVLNVDGKTFAQTSIDSINALTRQTGSLDLILV